MLEVIPAGEGSGDGVVLDAEGLGGWVGMGWGWGGDDNALG